jgi:phosphate transport system substrate-binding protein
MAGQFRQRGLPDVNRNVLSRRVLAGVALAALALAGCGGNNNDAVSGEGDSGEQLSGAVNIDGSSTVAPLSKAAADIFSEEQSGVNVTVGTSGTGGGFEKFCKGETDISDASRQIEDDEKAACSSGGVTFTEFVVANDALTVVVHKENTWATCLTVDELKKIWEPNSKVNNWSQVRSGFPNESLKLFGPGTDSGTFDYFTDEINGEEGASRTDYTPSENDNVLVQGVAGSKGGLGYFGYTYYELNQDKLKAVEVDGGSGCVAPSKDTASGGSYKPLSRPLYIYVNNASFNDRPQVAGFVQFYVENIDEIITEAEFVPLNPTQKSELTAALDTAKAA